MDPGMLSPGRTLSAPLPVEMPGVFQRLPGTAVTRSPRPGKLPADASATTTPPAASSSDPRPLPMHQRRPQRVDPGQVNPKRRARFGAPGEAAGPSAPFPPVGADAPPEPDGSPGALPSGASPGQPPGTDTPPPERFQARGVYTPAGEEGPAPRGRGRGWALAAAAFALGLAGGWASHRPTVPGNAPAPPKTVADPGDSAARRPPTDPATAARAAGLVNQALRAEKGGDVARATDLFTEAGKICPTFPGIHYRLALLCLRNGERNRAQVLLARSLAAGEEVAAVHQLRSALARLDNQPDLGFTEHEDATRADPFNARYPYYWAETLRRAGRPQEAREKLEDAVIRAVEPTEESLYRLKLRLVMIGLDQEDEFATEVLAQTHDAIPAPPEWLLTAAALDLKRGDYAGAAAYLTRARQILPPAVAAFLFNDQTFLDHAWRPELAPLYAPGSDAVPPRPPAPDAVAASPAPVPPGSSSKPASVGPGARSRPKAP